ncbi:hypothetical protein [Flavobacterium sp. NRK F7]|uniref:hypothetical protein n=1 Tax=Flavobacterium sp. NRK F7 TaxID=2954930 RepID=UPI0020917E0D|nr:hypothetical protein [Flavobacterium sp. NRK F7]MCO6163007.1 hypothetical protein [Flavobacterium sp. NRK F7]
MQPIWKKINLAIAIINLIIGFGISYFLVQLSIQLSNYSIELAAKNEISEIHSTYFYLFLHHQSQLLTSILLIISPIFILKEKRLGWIFSYSCWVILTLNITKTIFFRIIEVTKSNIYPDYWLQIYGGIGFLLSWSVLVLLSTKPIRILNKVNRKSWYLSLGLFLILYLMKQFL